MRVPIALGIWGLLLTLAWVAVAGPLAGVTSSTEPAFWWQLRQQVLYLSGVWSIGMMSLVMLLSLITSYAVALRLATALALAFIVVIFVAGVVAWARGLRVARYFVIAWSAFLLGGLVNTLMVLGYLPNVFLTMYASQIGSAIEVGLLSLAPLRDW